MAKAPYTETRTQIESEQPSLHDAFRFIDSHPEEQLTAVRMAPTTNDPGKWTVTVYMTTNNMEADPDGE